MKKQPVVCLTQPIFLVASTSFADAQNFKDTGYLTFDTKPMGSVDRPLILRTYCPDPKLDRNLVLGNHSRGTSVAKYSAGSGKRK